MHALQHVCNDPQAGGSGSRSSSSRQDDASPYGVDDDAVEHVLIRRNLECFARKIAKNESNRNCKN